MIDKYFCQNAQEVNLPTMLSSASDEEEIIHGIRLPGCLINIFIYYCSKYYIFLFIDSVDIDKLPKGIFLIYKELFLKLFAF